MDYRVLYCDEDEDGWTVVYNIAMKRKVDCIV